MGFFKNKKLLAIIGGAIVALVVFATLIIINHTNKLSELEKIALSDFSSKFMLYAEDVDIDESREMTETELEKYIGFVMTYVTNEEGKDKLTKDELFECIRQFFDYEPSEEEFGKLGISLYLKDRGINFSDETGEIIFTIDRYSKDKRTIAGTPFVTYVETGTKVKGSEIQITYDKYILDNPHHLVGAISDAGNEDMASIRAYLDGRGKISALKKAARNLNMSEQFEPKGRLTVIYVVKDGKILVKSLLATTKEPQKEE